MIGQGCDEFASVTRLEQRAVSVRDVSSTDSSNPDWPSLVKRAQDGDGQAIEQLYGLFSRGIRYYLRRQLGPDEVDDKVHDTLLVVVKAIQCGDLREPERIMGFVRTVVRRQVAAYIDQAVHRRTHEVDMDIAIRLVDIGSNPELNALARERVDLARAVLEQMSATDREILCRFYLHEQSQEQICREMHLTETQFRLHKSRAKARFAELGRRRLEGGVIRSVRLQLARSLRLSA